MTKEEYRIEKLANACREAITTLRWLQSNITNQELKSEADGVCDQIQNTLDCYETE
ncbi:MAG: hypothetical protein LBQ54_07495 [Planctomycetaceae bacterium]|jgi:hypothetical protein|nr:hypothetical protein [Planctomycetaceae bacterium]